MVVRGAVLAILVMGTTSCSSLAIEDAARAARDFVRAVTEKRTDDACALTAPRAVRDGDCAAAMSELDDLGEVRAVQVRGEGARAESGATVMFPHEFQAGWRITAAGCEGDGEAPYDCVVGGPWSPGWHSW